jgi:hypothetical protein
MSRIQPRIVGQSVSPTYLFKAGISNAKESPSFGTKRGFFVRMYLASCNAG